MPRKKYFRSEREAEGQCASNWWNHELYGYNQDASRELEKLFGFKNAFSNPKPIKLIRTVISLANVKENDIVLDFFSGSRVIIMTEANSLVKSKVLKLLPKLKTEETDGLCAA